MNDPISEWWSVSTYDAKDEGYVRAADTKAVGETGGGRMNTGTLTDMACAECGKRGENVAWHGHNCYYRCPECETVNHLTG